MLPRSARAAAWWFLLLLLPAAALSAPMDKAAMRERFDALDAAINGGEGYVGGEPDGATLAWSQSYLLEAYLDMYEGTGDNAYLEKFVRQADRVCASTDKARGRKDYRGASTDGWSAMKYSRDGEPLVFMVHSGMILFPLARFGLMVRDDPSLSRYGEAAARYVRLAETAVAGFDDVWRKDGRTGEGTYWFSGDEPLKADLSAPMAFNNPLALGRVIVTLYRITGKPAYHEKAAALARYFRAGLREDRHGAYLWGYRRDLKKYSRMEDLSHGAIDVDFALQAHRAGIVFTEADMRRFGRTLVRAKRGDLFSVYVNGENGRENPKSTSHSAGRWLDLSPFDCAVYESVYDYMSARGIGEKEPPTILLGIAKLLKHHDRCRPSGKPD